MDLELSGRNVVVTGGASGIGRAIVEAFLREGCQVVVWDRSQELPTLIGELQTAGDRAWGISCDVADEISVRNAESETRAAVGRIDHCVHAAAIGSGKFGFPFTMLEPRDWKRVLEVNILGMVHVAHAVSADMVARKAGTLVFLASIAGQIGSQTDPPYSASKAANINFAQCLAKDLAPHRIRVNTVCPGMVKTPLNESIWKAWADRQSPENWQSYDEWASSKIRNHVPLNEWQTPQDIADMVVFLSSARSRAVTGQTINVDGGFVMHW